MADKAVVIAIVGAGFEDANGLYVATGRAWHGAPVFENDKRCLLSREPHRNSKTGSSSFGWIVGQGRTPLYAVETEAVAPPANGWRKFKGASPIPSVHSPATQEGAVRIVIKSWKERGNSSFAERRYDDAHTMYTRALALASKLPDCDQDVVALYSNRAEVGLRKGRWAEALSDASEATARNLEHIKSLLRGAVAALEIERLQEAKQLLDLCLKLNPRLPAAQELAVEWANKAHNSNEALLPPEARKAAMWRRGVSGSSGQGDDEEHAQHTAQRSLNSEHRETQQQAQPPARIESLPYHNMNLPREQVEMMDGFFREMRAQKAERERRAKSEKDDYERIRREWRENTADGVAGGRLAPLEQILPAERARQQVASGAQSGEAGRLVAEFKPTARTLLPKKDAEEIDGLFAGKSPRPPENTKSSAQDSLRGAHLLRQIDKQAAEDRKALAELVAEELEALSHKAGGEPTRFEQARSEVYCWWALPDTISGRDVRVTAPTGGRRLKVEVRGKAIFDGVLFDAITVGAIMWTVSDRELHVTLTKADPNKLWEQLGEVPEVRRDAAGEVLLESIPAAMSKNERLAKFRQMVEGDDGPRAAYDDLDPRAKQLVDTLRRYEHARAVGDNNALALAEIDLEEFGQITI